MLFAFVGVAGAGELAWRSADLWQGGGGAFALIWALMAVLVATPLLLLERSLAQEGGRVMPGWAGWIALAVGALLLLGRLTRAAHGMGELGAALALLVVGAVVFALGRPRATVALAAVACALLVGVPLALGVALASGPGSAGLLVGALTPRVGALAHAEPWAHAVVAALATLPLLGSQAGLAPRSEARPGGGAGLAVAALGAQILALVGAFIGAGALLVASTPAPRGPPLGADAALHQALQGVVWGGVGHALVGLAGAAGLALALGFSLRGRLGQGALAATAPLLFGVGLLAAALAWMGAPGLLAAELISGWTSAVGLPLVALLLGLEARRQPRLVELCRRADPSGTLALQAWLPPLARTLLPGIAAFALLHGLISGLLSPPGAQAAEALGSLGPLSGALHVVAPAATLVLGVVVTTALAWAAPPEAVVGEER